MSKYLWCSIHTPTQEQLKSLPNLFMLEDVDSDLLNDISNIQLDTDLRKLAKDLLLITREFVLVQPGGSPAFQLALGQLIGEENERAFIYGTPAVRGPIYSFSLRVSEDIPQPDGSIKKISVFNHAGWV